MTITLGTQFEVDTDGGLARFAGLTASTGVALYSSAASGIEARHLTNSGGTITGGTVLSIDANAATSIAICALTSTSVLIGYAYGATHRVRILSVSGTTLTAEAVTNMTDTGVDFLACDALTGTKVIYCYMDSGNNGIARVLSISGVAITENAAFTYENVTTADNTSVKAFPDAISAIVCFNGEVEILDISGTTITGNTSTSAGFGVAGGDHKTDMAISISDATLILVVGAFGTGRARIMQRSGGSVSTVSSLLIMNGVGGTSAGVSATAVTGNLALVSLTDPSDYIYFAEVDIDAGTFDDTNTDTVISAAAASTEIGLLPGSTTAIAVWNDSTEAITVSLPAPVLGLAPMTKPAAIDAAGAFIYVALLQDSTPILTKISTALNADGTTVFNPGAGDNIGVECGRFNSSVVWVAGQFDGTNVLEKSEDAGTSFAVKDDATIGGVRAFIMGPDSDARIMVFDEDNSDILETRDDGATWKTINASVTPTINAIGRLGENVEESVFGNQGAANNSIDYSVNSGDDLEDYQTGVYPNANATRVIVN